MARPVQISDRDILAAARKIFLKRGVQATTAEVAEVAGVSEGSIFKRWKTKAELFHACLLDGDADENTGLDGQIPKWVVELSARVGRSTIEKEFTELVLELLAFYRLIVPLSAMAWSEPSARNRLRSEHAVPGPVRGVRALADYFRREMQLGRLRTTGAELVARTLMGATFNYAWMEMTFGADRAELEAENDFAKRLVELLLQGLAPDAADAVSVSPKKGSRR